MTTKCKTCNKLYQLKEDKVLCKRLNLNTAVPTFDLIELDIPTECKAWVEERLNKNTLNHMRVSNNRSSE